MADTSSAGGDRRQGEALAWLVRLNGSPSPEDRRGFAAWLADGANHAAFRQAEDLWRRIEAPAREEAVSLDPALVRGDRRPRHAPGRLRVLTACVALLCLLLAGFGVWLEHPTLMQDVLLADATTARGEQRRISLDDGSTALLGADTAVALRFGSTERRIKLLRGAAYFEVRRAAAPFVVETPSGEVRVLGTTFAVELLREGAVVTVASGRVEIATRRGDTAQLGGNQQMRWRAAAAPEIASVDAAESLGWRDGRLVFREASLREVAEQLARYRPGQILILNAQLAERRVTGSFPARDTEAALASLQAILGFQRQDFTPHLVTLR